MEVLQFGTIHGTYVDGLLRTKGCSAGLGDVECQEGPETEDDGTVISIS